MLKRKPKELVRSHFKYVDLGHNTGYFSFKDKEIELCIEPCLNGVDVAIYDHNHGLLRDKECTDLKSTDGIALAILGFVYGVEIANKFYKEYYEKPRG